MKTDIEDVTDRYLQGARPAGARPDFAFMRPRLSRWIALGAGSGLAGFAPGTFGSLFGWATFAVLVEFSGPTGVLALCLPAFVLGVWAVRRTGRDLGVVDHGAIVWDEVVAMWLVLALIPSTFASQLVGFLVFRFFDIVKPPPIRQVDRRLESAFGVMLDDILAAAYTVLLFALAGGLR